MMLGKSAWMRCGAAVLLSSLPPSSASSAIPLIDYNIFPCLWTTSYNTEFTFAAADVPPFPPALA